MHKPGDPNPALKKRMEVGKLLGKRIATNQEVMQYEASIGGKILEEAKKQNIPIEAFMERLPFYAYLRSIFTKDDIDKLKAASLQGCLDGNSHMAHQRMLEKLIEWAFGDPSKFGIDEQAKTRPVTILFGDSIEEREE